MLTVKTVALFIVTAVAEILGATWRPDASMLLTEASISALRFYGCGLWTAFDRRGGISPAPP